MIFSIGLTDLQQFLSMILTIYWEHALVSSFGGDDSYISLDKGLMTYVLQVENVRMLDRYNTRKPSIGTLYLTATHLIFVDPDGKKETWVCTIECHCYGVCQIVNYHGWSEFYRTQFTNLQCSENVRVVTIKGNNYGVYFICLKCVRMKN